MPTLVDDLHADGATTLEDDSRRQDLALDLQRPRCQVVDVAPRRGVPNAVLDVLLQPGDALLLRSVVVVEDLDAERVGGRLDELERGLLGHLVPGHLDRTPGSAVRVLAVLEVLRSLVRSVDLIG